MTEPVTVTQADVDAAKLYYKSQSRSPYNGIGIGADDYLAECFSRHRTAYAPSQPNPIDLWSIASFVSKQGYVRMELQLDDMGGYVCTYRTEREIEQSRESQVAPTRPK